MRNVFQTTEAWVTVESTTILKCGLRLTLCWSQQVSVMSQLIQYYHFQKMCLLTFHKLPEGEVDKRTLLSAWQNKENCGIDPALIDETIIKSLQKEKD